MRVLPVSLPAILILMSGGAELMGESPPFLLSPIGYVRTDDEGTRIVVKEEYEPALAGLDGFSHIYVIYWFDRNDVPEKRSILKVHPRGDPSNPLTGVFATRAPVRPNLIALSVCKIVSLRGNVLTIDAIDALPDTPVLDLKPYVPHTEVTGVRVPLWAR